MPEVMDLRAEAIESGIRALGGIQKVEFYAASGLPANLKVEMDVLEKSGLMRVLVRDSLADLALPFDPDLLIPMPLGADGMGKTVANHMGIDYALMRWIDKTPGHRKVVHRTREDLRKIRTARRIMLFDDVFSTGGTLLAAYNKPNIGEKTVGALTIWDRSDGTASQNFPVAVESIVKRHIPFWSEQT